jgi:hypothetical protein
MVGTDFSKTLFRNLELQWGKFPCRVRACHWLPTRIVRVTRVVRVVHTCILAPGGSKSRD